MSRGRWIACTLWPFILFGAALKLSFWLTLISGTLTFIRKWVPHSCRSNWLTIQQSSKPANQQLANSLVFGSSLAPHNHTHTHILVAMSLKWEWHFVAHVFFDSRQSWPLPLPLMHIANSNQHYFTLLLHPLYRSRSRSLCSCNCLCKRLLLVSIANEFLCSMCESQVLWAIQFFG